MQVGKVTWVGQTFALAKCSDSQGKKPRFRRTKEERRKMVESFIKRYRDSNNGNFPSLNLTHKEVGGSFYIVREIVREVIQENKVLRPGNSNSQAFSLVNCSEEHSAEPFSLTIEHQDNERMNEPSGYDVNINKMSSFSVEESTDLKEEFMLHLHKISVPPVSDGTEQYYKKWYNNDKSSNEHVELVGHELKFSPTKGNGKLYVADKNDITGSLSEYEIQTDNPVKFFLSPSAKSITGADVENEQQENDAVSLTSLFAERTNAFDEGSVCDGLENASSSGQAALSSPRHDEEPHTLHSKRIDNDVPVQTYPRKAESDTSGLTETAIATGGATHIHIQVCSESSDPSLESMGSHPSSIGDQEVAMSVKASPTEITDSSIHTTLQVEQPLVLSDEKMSSVNGRTFGEPVLDNSTGRSNAGEKLVGREKREPSETIDGKETVEPNPLLAMIKGIVTAFIKFWTE